MIRNIILAAAFLALVILGIMMIDISSKSGLKPPKLTGVGFIVIAVVFLSFIRKK